MGQLLTKWDFRFLKLAYDVSGWSKDPSTKVGAVIAKDKEILGIGYNGFPSAIEDDEYKLNDRDLKYPRIIHGELNAIKHSGGNIEGATLYTWPFQPCVACTIQVINYGISTIVAPSYENKNKTWINSFHEANTLLFEGGVKLVKPSLNEVTQHFMKEDTERYLDSDYVKDAKTTILGVLSDDHS